MRTDTINTPTNTPTDDEKISHHEHELGRQVARAVKRLEERGFFRDEPPKRKGAWTFHRRRT